LIKESLLVVSAEIQNCLSRDDDHIKKKIMQNQLSNFKNLQKIMQNQLSNFKNLQKIMQNQLSNF